MRNLAALGMVALTVAACSLVAVARPTPVPVKPTHGPVALRTIESFAPGTLCPADAIEGTLVEVPETGLGLLDGSGAVAIPVVWPNGFVAAPSVAGAILFDASGSLVAYTGERVRIQATQVAPGGALVVCGTVIRAPTTGAAT